MNVKKYDYGIARDGLVKWFNARSKQDRNTSYTNGVASTITKPCLIGASSDANENKMEVISKTDVPTYGTGYLGDAMTDMYNTNYVDLNNIFTENYLGDYTIEMAFQILWTDGGNGGERYLFCSGHGQTSHQLRIQCKGGKIFTIVAYPCGGGAITFNEANCVDTDDFIYLTVSVSNSTNTWKVYMNKILKYTGSGKVGINPSINKGLYIGCGRSSTNTGAIIADLDCQVFDYKIYNRALNADEVNKNHDAFKTSFIGKVRNKYNSCSFSYDYSERPKTDTSNRLWWRNSSQLSSMETSSENLRGNTVVYNVPNVSNAINSKGGLVFQDGNTNMFAIQNNMKNNISSRGVTVYVAVYPNNVTSAEQGIFTNHDANGCGIHIMDNVIRGYGSINGSWAFGKAYTPVTNMINYYAWSYDGANVTTVYSNDDSSVIVTKDGSKPNSYVASSTKPFCIGAKPTGGVNTTSPFKGGVIYACRVFNGGISSNDIVAMINEDKVRLGYRVIN